MIIIVIALLAITKTTAQQKTVLQEINLRQFLGWDEAGHPRTLGIVAFQRKNTLFSLEIKNKEGEMRTFIAKKKVLLIITKHNNAYSITIDGEDIMKTKRDMIMVSRQDIKHISTWWNYHKSERSISFVFLLS